MSFTNIIALLGGLGMFLFGMRYMSDGLNQVAGNRLKNMLERLTRNRFKGFLFGVLMTAIIQSSSATTVIIMGFLNAGVMDLAQATGVIIGANIGTTVTAILIALDISAIAPVCIFVGMIFALFSKKHVRKYIGQIILGFGILFQGLSIMSSDDAMGVLKTSEGFQNFILSVNNPALGIIIGIIICAILQSSSAAVGILQTLALQGLIPTKLMVFIILGINVGAVTPLFISSIGAKTNAKRAAFIYFLFDLLGMLIFIPITLFTPYADFVESITANGSACAAVIHITFNVFTALISLPFVNLFVSLSKKIIVQKEHETNLRFLYIDTKLKSNVFSSVLQATKEVERMSSLVRDNLALTRNAVTDVDLKHERRVRDNEEIINWLNVNITEYLVTVTSHSLPGETSDYVGKLFHVVTNLERIGDHVISILDNTREIKDSGLGFTEAGLKDISLIYDEVIEIYDNSINCFFKSHLSPEEEHRLRVMRDTVNDLSTTAQDNHVERLRRHECHTASGIIFSKIIQDLEHIGGLSYNTARNSRKDIELIKKI